MNEELDGLLSDWNETYKKSQLSFWILLAISDSEKYMAEILTFLSDTSDGSLDVKEQSLYRALRRFKDMKLVLIAEHPSPHGGPNRKYFTLSPIGRQLLAEFIRQNITPMYSPTIVSLINKAQEGAQ